jgi:sec-independent protein translocase protein TatB
MLFDLGMSELLLIGVVALVVIGPKDLPRALRVAGYWVRKARTLSREFQSSVEQMIREAELDEVRQELKKATEVDLETEFRRSIDPTGDLAESLKPPELPKFSEHDPAGLPAPVSEPHPQSETESAPAEASPSPEAIESSADVPADTPDRGSPPHEAAVSPAEAGLQGSRESPATPRLPLAQE